MILSHLFANLAFIGTIFASRPTFFSLKLPENSFKTKRLRIVRERVNLFLENGRFRNFRNEQSRLNVVGFWFEIKEKRGIILNGSENRPSTIWSF